MKNIFKRSLAFALGLSALVLPFSEFSLVNSSVFTPVTVSAVGQNVSYSFDYKGSVSYASSASFPFDVDYTTSAPKVLCVAFSNSNYNFQVFFTNSYFPDNSEVTIKISCIDNHLSISFRGSNEQVYHATYYVFRNGSYTSSLTNATEFSYNGVSIDNVYANSDYITDPVYRPSYDGLLVGFPVAFQFNEQDFYNWIINNNKLSELPAYITQSKLLSFLSFYKNFGSSNISFVTRIVSWFSHMNIANQSNENIVILKRSIDKLYQEYINQYKHEFYSNSANQAHHRRNVNTQTTDDDLTLITDDINDDIYTTLLREIIRGIVAIQSSTVSGCRAIIDTLNNLDFTVNLANNGGDFVGTDLSVLYEYNSNDFNDDLETFQNNIENIQNVPQGYIDTINQNELMPENMLEDKNSLTVNVPCITGFTIGNNGSTYSTQTGNYTLSSSDYPWLDPVVQKIKRFGSILLIIGYLVHLRYRIPELLRGE